ncbi:hypothetical protein ACH489_19520 [Streptomyces rubiginosohelvolus]|uniref:hypothetical protein n=1 Tax=Streptomyces rubiginosohelvolus TaxID=67362 RepID=UPI0037AAA9DE
MAARRCPRLRSKGHVALLATRFPLYGVIGTPYQFTGDGIQPLASSDAPLPYSHPQTNWFLASQLVRELREYKVVNMDDLVPLRTAARRFWAKDRTVERHPRASRLDHRAGMAST